MSTSHVSAPAARAVDVTFTDEALVVRLKDGRILSVPLSWFPRLVEATVEQRSNWQLIGDGLGVHWAELDEDVSIAGLLGVAD